MPYSYYYYGIDPTYILVLIGAVICMIASARVKSTYNKYSKYRSASGMTGAEAAQRILNTAGIYDVTIQHVSGNLTDHYNPANKTLNLSDSVYGSTSVAAVGVAAHEWRTCDPASEELCTADASGNDCAGGKSRFHTRMAADSDRAVIQPEHRGIVYRPWNHLLFFCSDFPVSDPSGRVQCIPPCVKNPWRTGNLKRERAALYEKSVTGGSSYLCGECSICYFTAAASDFTVWRKRP